MNNNNINTNKLKGCSSGAHGPQQPPPRSAGSSCAACKLLKRRCTVTCIFAPHFRADEIKKFAKVHKVFGASNVSKILVEVAEEHREDTVNSLVYEADARLRDPVNGCIGAIALLQRKMLELQHDLALARARLARYTTTVPVPDSTLQEEWADGDGGVVGFHDQMAMYSGDGGGCSQIDGRGFFEFGHDQVQLPPFPL